jgi:hypothetical protein
MGDQVRFSPEGPRDLTEADRRPDGKPKVVRKPDASLVKQSVAARYEPIMDPERQAQLVALLDQRGGTQRGKPRSRDAAQNPLGCRVFDMACRWPMYRQPYGKAFRYTCGLYQQSHGAQCAHNHVDGPTAVRFLLGCLRQRVLTPRLLAKLEERLRQLAAQEAGANGMAQEISAKERALAEVRAKLNRAGQNLALAETPQQYKMVAQVVEGLTRHQEQLQAELAGLRRAGTGAVDLEAEVAAAMELVHGLTELTADPGNTAALGEAFRRVNARLFLRFEGVQVRKRKLNQLVSGVVTFGSAPPPIVLYEGPTGRREVKSPASSGDAGPCSSRAPLPPESSDPGEEGGSFGNGRRGDWIRTSDLLNPINPVCRRETAENLTIPRLTSFHLFQGLQGFSRLAGDFAASCCKDWTRGLCC